jgi:alkylation response protein AidB-like acyl-CoA dehydrogenase
LAGLVREILADRKPSDPSSLDRPLWTDLAAAGVLAATLPTTVGGDGYGLAEQCTILGEIGRAAAAVPYLPCIVAASALAAFGDPHQVQRWVAPAGRGEAVLTVALTGGPALGGAGASVHARHSANGFVLDGSCTTVPAAPYADLILVPVEGHGAFLVTPDDDGVSIEPQQVAGGPGEGFLDLRSAVLPPDRRLGGEAVVGWLRDRMTVGLCATQLGVLEKALELTAEYARTREQFGRAIGTFQAVAQRLADAYIDLEGVRLTLWQAAWRLSGDLPCTTEIATAKFWAAEAGHRVAHTAVHVHGGVGIDVEHPVHRYFLAAKYNELTLGGATAQLLHIGESLIDSPFDDA